VELVNDTPASALLQIAELARPPLAAVVIAKSTFDLEPDGELRWSADPMPLVPGLLYTVFGMFHGEGYFKKSGVDLCVLGTVRRDEEVTSARVRLSVAHRALREITVFGDRRWVRSAAGKLVPSEPESFLELPLSYDYAYGGSAPFQGLLAPFTDNPVGRGYYLEEEHALHQRLPNIVWSHDPRPERFDAPQAVAGFGPYPSFWGLRALPNVIVDAETSEIADVRPAIFNHAHPEVVLPELAPGTPIAIEGLNGDIAFAVPPEPVRIEIEVGERRERIAAPIDGVFVWADARKVVITQRARFAYEIVSEERRRAFVGFH
jgi:hypothetical protein